MKSQQSPSHISSADALRLNFDKLEHIDFDHLLKRFNEVSVSAGNPVEFDAIDSDSDSETDDKDSLLMRELELLHTKQLEVTAPTPTSGKADDPLIRTLPSTMSVGVSACLDNPNITPCFLPTTQTVPEERGTVYLDLRNEEDKTTRQKV